MALFSVFYIFLIHILFTTHGVPIPEENDTLKASEYLEHYGYLNNQFKLREDNSLNEEELKNALKIFQNNTHLNVTGELDNATIEQMHKPRCGLPDVNTANHNLKHREKRYIVHAFKWAIQDLTYRINHYSSQFSVNETNIAINKALKLWSSVAQINFRNASLRPFSPVNINIGFYKGVHGDNDPFDGNGGTLAHAFFPPYGDLHFDDDEDFTLMSVNGTNFLSVATHELGHSLGLEHSFVQGAVMFPYYQPYEPDKEYELHSDDIAGIQFLYGARGDTSQNSDGVSTPTSNYPAWRFPGTIICQSQSIDAMFHNPVTDLTTVFKGSNYWVMDYFGVKQGYPKSIHSTWPPFPVDIDAALYWPANPKTAYPATTFIFKDSNVYTLINDMLVTAGPISRVFPGLPSSINSAVAVIKDNITYFTKGYQLYTCTTYNTQSVRLSTSSVFRWSLTHADAAVYYQNYMYLFVGAIYYGFDDRERIMPGYPKSISIDWHGCSGNIPREEERSRNGAPNLTTSKIYIIFTLFVFHLLKRL